MAIFFFYIIYQEISKVCNTEYYITNTHVSAEHLKYYLEFIYRKKAVSLSLKSSIFDPIFILFHLFSRPEAKQCQLDRESSSIFVFNFWPSHCWIWRSPKLQFQWKSKRTSSRSLWWSSPAKWSQNSKWWKHKHWWKRPKLPKSSPCSEKSKTLAKSYYDNELKNVKNYLLVCTHLDLAFVNRSRFFQSLS